MWGRAPAARRADVVGARRARRHRRRAGRRRRRARRRRLEPAGPGHRRGGGRGARCGSGSTGTVPTDWAGQPRRRDPQPRVQRPGARLHGRGHDLAPCAATEWEPERGLHPANHIVRRRPVASPAASSVDYLVEASANPLMWGLESTVNSDRDTAGSTPDLRRSRAIDLAVRNLDVVGPPPRPARPDRADARSSRPTPPAPWELLAAVDRCLDALDLDDVAGTAPAGRGPSSPRCCRVRRCRRPTASPPSATPTSTRPGCGRSARPSASAPARSRNVLRTDGRRPRASSSACSQAAQYEWMREGYPSVFDGIARARSPRAGGSRSAACGSRPTAT